ncbi:RES family NAD+ phosphorylase [Escherichia coli]|uniref:RES family NAD+ phosphorylase n=1 Tax=Escherichia coli TaxID=562 RepID=UPI00182F0071|nr:RES family NAD+ phosphorylase [Escherichia coli]EFH3744885.1 RES domain-containing protein [Escherichia coli]EHD5841287.1 RES family NAD+ phosphorylase [Escherichia coli]EID6773301.1 RES family NAD+ phosphorylase [Escherichia coli]EKO0565973.1 RES family NAD+ phosphorylase [Escherichia coli]EKP8508200.1 RES family NAD+ phosphorylase [Escherichia coli]
MKTKQVLQIDYVINLADEIRASSSESFIEKGIQFILTFYELINFNFSYTPPFLRARKTIDSKPFNSTSEIYYPPPAVTRAGRLNEPGVPFLYLSATIDTALIEIGAKTGDIVQISGYSYKKEPARLGLIGEIYRAAKGTTGFLDNENRNKISELVSKMGQQNRKIAIAYLFLDLFFDEIIRNPEANQHEYLHSRILSRLLLEKNKSIDGFIYHSVANYGALNFAFPYDKAEKYLGLVHTFLVRVIKSYPYGLYDIEIIKKPKQIDNMGNIIW